MESATRIRTISGALKWIKDQDPDTSITEYQLRRWIAENKLPCIKSGNKNLINLEVLSEFLKGTFA